MRKAFSPSTALSLGAVALSLSVLGTPPAASAAPAGGSIGSSRPGFRVEVFPSVGLSIPGIHAGLDARFNSAVEIGARLGVLPLLPGEFRTLSGHVNFYSDNPEPWESGTWFYGTELAYAEERNSTGYFETLALNLVLGREHRLARRLRFAYGFGGGFLLLQEFKGGGAPIMLPISVTGMLELRLQAF